MNALAVRHGGAAVTIVQRGVVIALRPGDGHAPALCIVGETAPRLVVNRRITFTVEGEVQRGSQADDIHPVSLFTHPGVFAPGIAPAHAGQAMQWQY